MKIKRTKRLTIDRALKIIQLKFGTQVQTVNKNNGLYIVDSICDVQRVFTRLEILDIENEIYSSFGF